MAFGGAKSKSKNAVKARLGDEKYFQLGDILNTLNAGYHGGQEGAAKYDEKVRKSQEESKMIRKEQRKEAGGILKQCGGCGERGKNRCLGCLMEFYCGEDCQRKEWGSHKQECKKVRKQFKMVIITDLDTMGEISGNAKSMIKMTKGKVTEKYLIVKITVTGLVMMANILDLTINDPLLRSPGQEELYDQLRKQVLEKGQELPALPGESKKFKAFFFGMYKGRTDGGDGHRIKINPEQVLPMREW